MLFCDIRDFTNLSQQLSPYDLIFVLNRYFVHMADAIERDGGHIEKFIGDAIMAMFSIDDTPDIPLHAIKAATDMRGAADRMKPYMKAMYDKDFDVGIGLHYGEAVIGTVSGGREEKLAAIGDTVNVASRIESANKEAGTRLLISAALHQQVETQVEVSDFVRERLRGTNERMSLYEVIRLTPEAEAQLSAHLFRLADRRGTQLGPRLQADGTSKGWEFMGDISKNRAPMKPLPCLARDGSLWVALG